MKRISKPVFGCVSALTGGLAVFCVLQLTSLGRETNNIPPHFNLQETPINREAHGVTSYSPVIKRAAPLCTSIR